LEHKESSFSISVGGYNMDEEKKNETNNDLERQLQELAAESPKSKNIKISLILRFIGFALIVVAFVLVMLIRQGKLTGAAISNITFAIAGTGFVVYLGSRIFEISANIRAKRKK
jgi:esterase/lipase superfamily enzyme